MNSLTIALLITMISLFGFGTYKAADPGVGDVQYTSDLGDSKDGGTLLP